jgi:hypothetical protein
VHIGTNEVEYRLHLYSCHVLSQELLIGPILEV